MLWFAIATLSPALIIASAVWLGGAWIWAALAYATIFVALADRLGDRWLPADDRPETARAGTRLSIILALSHLALLALGIWGLAGSGLTLVQKAGLFIALGLYLGQVGNSNAHELIHHAAHGPRCLGTLVFIAFLFGHHASAHPKVHHVWVASPRDPNTARKGESAYRFIARAWIGSFRAGWQAEDLLRARHTPPPNWISHPYTAYIGGALLALAFAWLSLGLWGVASYLALAGHIQSQLMLSDYVQHYGLTRKTNANGRLEPAGDAHSWNAPQWYSGAMMLNAPRHSDHHAHPNRPFPALDINHDKMPLLPASLPVMASIALIPPIWRRIMDPRVALWQSD